ncbi:helicase domino isoform X2 [Copidosoma floridanum]|uniref:helicase domino isoform X2 n=1 Tax=Copidosoma floridanum TaxID=29053 RepID=UPI0006C94CA2|nr:helicase domino isoform X2 [Copidosoma floridanum]
MSDKQGAPTLPPLSGGGGIINGGSNGGAPQQTVSFQQVFANVISSANVQQFVLASQVPGPTQVLPRSGTSGQPIGLTRIINLSGAPPRVGVVNVTTASPVGVACATPAPGHQSKLVLTTSPKLVRTSIANMLQRPPAPTTSQPQQQPQQQQQQQQQQQSPSPSLSSSQQQPPAKKKRVTDGGVSIPERPAGQHQHEPPADVMGYRRRIIEHKLRRLNAIRDKYNENLSEYYFLHNSGNILDFLAWKERPPTPRYLSFLKQHQLEPQEVAGGAEEQQKETIATPTTTTAVAAAATTTTASARAAAATVTSQTTSAAATTVATTTTPSAASSESEPQPATTAATVATVATTSSSTVAAVAGASSSSSSTAMTAAVQSSTAINPSTSDCSSSNSGGNSSGNSSNNGSGKPAATTVTVVTVATSSTPMVSDDQGGAEVALSGGTPVAVSTTLPPAVAQLSQQGQVPGRPQGGRHGMIFAFRAAIQSSPVTAHPSPTTTTSTIAPVLVIGSTPVVIDSPKSNTATANNPVSDKTPTSNPADKLLGTPPISSAQPVVKLVKLSPSSIASSSCDTVSNQEQIVEKAKQEAYVMQRIAELQREGLWSEKRLPKVQEPPRPKTHWDYLLEEMVWLSTDFAQERKWKKSAAKKCARMVQKYFQEKALQAQKAEKLEELRLKKIAGFIAKEIKTFWANVEKLVEYKQQTRLEEKRKKALDQHLNFIVDQTEKYSTWLTEGLNKTEGNQSTPASIHSSRISSPLPAEKHSDDDFKPNQDSDDDEETIAKAEEEIKSNHKEEVELLKKESELPLEDFLRELPPNYLEERDMSLSPELREVVEEESDGTKDTDFTVASELSSDDEDTIQKQEQSEKNIDHKQEIDELNAENEMSIEQLMEKYGATSETTMELEDSDEESGKDEDEEDDSESENETEDEDDVQNNSQTQSDDDTTIGLKSLLEDISDENKSFNETSEKQNEMDSVAAIAESIQPKGNTLLTTSVVTKIPFLLKHSLREYQHIGLDWLVTMYERKLNGILADEMGLGKTIQTIALLAHLACEKGNWGPHLIIVPTSVMLNWEMECKKWCPGFKILTYYGSQKERKQKRMGWTKPNAFHVCITSYKLVIQDHQSFRRKKWKYLILDEAQNIKNFKSQRWQLLLNFQTQRRLLLTGTPLQNNLMELWSLMHFLMPNVFQSHREFKEWFSNPVTGMIEGNSEYNENIIRRLHKVLRPFLLRRLKCEVEKQLPKKYEHVVVCRLSKRQRYLYDDFMSRAKTKETLASGNLLSVMNVLMQLRKVCNHPNLFEVRPTVSPFQMDGIDFYTASLAWSALDYDPFKHINLSCLNLHLVDLEFTVTAFVAHRLKKLKTPRKLIEEIDSYPEPPPRCPSGKIKIHVRLSNQVSKANTAPQLNAQQMKMKSFPGILPTPRVGTSPLVRSANSQTPTGQGVTLKVAGGQQMQGFSLQLVPHQGGVKAIPVQTVPQSVHGTASATPTSANISTHKISVSTENTRDGTQKLIYTVKQGEKASFARLVQTSTGNHLILTNPNQTSNALITPSGQRLHVLPQKHRPGLSSMSVNKVIGNVVTSTGGIVNKPVMRVSPLNISTSQSTGQVQVQSQQIRAVRNIQKNSEKNPTKEIPKSEFYLPELELMRQQKLHAKLKTLANVNEKKCAAFPLYGKDLFSTLKVTQPAKGCEWPNSWFNCASAKQSVRTRRQYFACTESLSKAIKSIEQVVEEMKDIFDKFMIYVPAAQASRPRFHVSHPSPSKLWQNQRLELELNHHLSSKVSLFHPITRSMQTQFPDVRLIQYDCGKLQSLDLLLRKLKYGDHRVLIFTQMTRMLDVLEAFLNYHGYIYLRLDGATRVDQRQVLMERFNNDKRIFCFILSTRSGGIGVNLTGADTVVFYDSDWNPTMDAQAQDRCHRIGQTRDVHIYRLISERTVEENILKKANQKRLLGDLAIEGGNFTTAYFKSSTIQDLFNVDQSETDASERMAEVLEQSKDRERNLQKETTQSDEKTAMGALESALAAVEEDLDVQAAKTAKAEAVADLAEFDENIPVDDADNDEAQISKAEMEVRNLVSQLTPIERFAMRFVEESDGMFSAAQLAAAERELEEQKKEWELDRLRAMREEEERQMRMTDDDENPITFTREDAQNQVNNSSNSRRRGKGRRPSRPSATIKRRVRENRRLSARQSRRQTRIRSCHYRNVEEEKEGSSSAVSSESESETVSMSNSESNDEDIAEEVGTSSDEERKSNQTDTSDKDDNEDEEDNSEEDEIGGRIAKRRKKNSILLKVKKNHLDLNSPRTRSRGDVKINLWTLDVSPLLPEGKSRHRSRKSKHSLSEIADDSDAKTVSDYRDNSTRKINDTSTNSSADENMSVEDDTELHETGIEKNDNTVEIRTRRSSRFSNKSSDKEKVACGLPNVIVNEVKSTCQKTIIPTGQEAQQTESKDHVVGTPNKCGRTRKQSQSIVESNSITYSTRSSNKLGRSPNDKKVMSLSVDSKEELEICDINDTSSKHKKSVESNSIVNARLLEEPLRPKNAIVTSDVPNKEDEVTKAPPIPENYEQFESSEKPSESYLFEKERSPSPILSLRKAKITRSYGRARVTEPKIKPAIVMVVPPDLRESQQMKSPEKLSSGSDQDHHLLLSPMDIEEFSPEREICENDVPSVREQSPLRASPILSSSSRFTKSTRSAAAAAAAARSTEMTHKQQVTSSESKNKTIDHRPVEKAKAADKIKTPSIESTVSVVAEASSSGSCKVAAENVQNEQLTKGKMTRSSARLASDTKTKEKTINAPEAPSDQSIVVPTANAAITTNEKEKAPIFVSKIESTKKIADGDEQPPVRMKITRSKDPTKVQTSDELHSKNNTTASSDIAMNSSKRPSDKLKSPERQPTVVDGPTSADLSFETPKITTEKITSPDRPNESFTSPSQEKPTSENDVPVAKKLPASNLKSPHALVLPESKQSIKIESTSVLGVTTRRSRVNCSAETSSESSSNNNSSTATKANVVKPIEPQLMKTSNSIESGGSMIEARIEKHSSLVDIPLLEQPRARSNVQQVPNPLNRRFQQSLIAKPGVVAGLRRRPDTPMPVFYAVRPVTRSLSGNHNNHSNNGNSSDAECSNSGNFCSPSGLMKLGPRSPRIPVDNGFVVPPSPPIGVRRARSTTYIKMSDRLALERKEIVVPQSRGLVRDPALTESLTINRVISKRRPDTPMPSPEQQLAAKMPRTSLDNYLPVPRSLPSIPKLRQHHQVPSIRKALPSSPLAQPLAEYVTPKSLAEAQQPQPSPPRPSTPPSPPPPPSSPPTPPPVPAPLVQELLTDAEEIVDSANSNGNSLDLDEPVLPVHEKPQRTAKVVAILSLDTKSNSSKAGYGLSTPQKTKPTSEISVINNSPRSSRPSRAAAHQAMRALTAASIEDSSSNSSSSSSGNPMPATDVDNESELDDVEMLPSKRFKRTRSQSNQSVVMAKPATSSPRIASVELEDDEKIPPKRSARLNAASSVPPLSSTSASASTNDKLNNPAI